MPSRQDIVDFMEAKAQTNGCPFCGQNNWGIVEDAEGAAILFMQQLKPSGLQPGRGVGVYIANCGNCAFVRSLGANAVDQFLGTRAQQPTEP